MNELTSQMLVTGDDSLGLELLEDGGFRIHGMEFQNQELRPVKMQGLEVERTAGPESVLAVKARQVARRFVFRDGLWFELGPDKSVAGALATRLVRAPGFNNGGRGSAPGNAHCGTQKRDVE